MVLDAGNVSLLGTLRDTLGAAANQPTAAIFPDGSGMELNYSRVPYSTPIASIDEGGSGMTFDYRPNLPQDGLEKTQENILANAEDEAQPPIGSIKSNADGTTDLTGVSGQLLKQLLGSMKFKQQAMQGMLQQEALLKQREEATRTVPGSIANVLATVAGNLAANDPKLPGWVRGLGAASLQLNPTAQQLSQQRVGLQQILMKAAGDNATETAALLRTLQGDEKEKRLVAGAVSKNVRDVFDKAHDAAKVSGATDTKAVADALEAVGADPKKAAAMAAVVGSAAEAKHKAVVEQRSYTDAMKAGDWTHKEAIEKYKADQIASRSAIVESNKDRRQAVALAQQKAISEGGRGAIQDRQAANREMRAYSKVEKDVLAASDTVSGIQHLRQLLKANPEYVGVIEGRLNPNLMALSGAWTPEQARKASEVRATFFTMLNDVKDTLGAGSYFWRPVEFANLTPKLARAVNDQQVNLGILDALEADVKRNATRLVLGTQDVDWAARKDSFGDLSSYVFSQVPAKVGLQGPAGGAAVAPAPAAAPTVSTPPNTVDKGPAGRPANRMPKVPAGWKIEAE